MNSWLCMVKIFILGEVMVKEGLQLNTVFKILFPCSPLGIMASLLSKLPHIETWQPVSCWAVHNNSQLSGFCLRLFFLILLSTSGSKSFFFFFNLWLICQISVFSPPFPPLPYPLWLCYHHDCFLTNQLKNTEWGWVGGKEVQEEGIYIHTHTHTHTKLIHFVVQ